MFNRLNLYYFYSFLSAFAETDNENGERSLHCPKIPSPTRPVPPQKPGNASSIRLMRTYILLLNLYQILNILH